MGSEAASDAEGSLPGTLELTGESLPVEVGYASRISLYVSFRGETPPDQTTFQKLKMTLDGIQVPGPEAAVTLAPAGQLEISAPALEVGETARAALYDPEGRPIHVSAMRPDPAFTLRGGSPTTLASVKAGVWRLKVVYPDGGRAETAVTVEAGRVRSVLLP